MHGTNLNISSDHDAALDKSVILEKDAAALRYNKSICIESYPRKMFSFYLSSNIIFLEMKYKILTRFIPAYL